ncbi:MAG: hypothetical protein IT324_14020 [Anaerolineae bacterium]|nr:hypothetical protein [Anaerolineae bacterium]
MPTIALPLLEIHYEFHKMQIDRRADYRIGAEYIMLALLRNVEMVQSPMPNVGSDLVAIDAEGYFDGLPADRVMATLEMLRHGEITVQRAALLIGISEPALIDLLKKLPVDDLRVLAQTI